MTIEQIKQLITKPDYDFLRTDPHLGDRIMFLTLGGSYSYGTNISSSDIDIRGCAMNNASELIGLSNFEQFINTDTDTTIYAFNKLIPLLLNCNPNTIEMLGCKPEPYTGNDIAIKMALLLHDIGKPYCYTEDERGGHFYGHPAASHKIAEDILSRLKFDNKTRDAILELVLYHDVEIKPSKRVARRLLNKLGTERVRQLIEVRKSDILGQTNHIQSKRLYAVDEFAAIVEEIVADQECFKVKDLAVNGHDILNLGVEGITVGKVLNHLLEMIMDEQIENEHDTLIEEAKVFLKGE